MTGRTPPVVQLTDHDKRTLRETFPDLRGADGPEVVMLSCGYADVWPDGDVTHHGRVIAVASDYMEG